jgi:hypothetical protein
MSLSRYAILVAVLVVLGLVTVWQHLDLLSAGYEINDLRAKREDLEEEARILERRIDSMATPAAAAAQLNTNDPQPAANGGTR